MDSLSPIHCIVQAYTLFHHWNRIQTRRSEYDGEKKPHHLKMHLLLKLPSGTSILHQGVVRIETRNLNSVFEFAENLYHMDINDALVQTPKI